MSEYSDMMEREFSEEMQNVDTVGNVTEEVVPEQVVETQETIVQENVQTEEAHTEATHTEATSNEPQVNVRDNSVVAEEEGSPIPEAVTEQTIPEGFISQEDFLAKQKEWEEKNSSPTYFNEQSRMIDEHLRNGGKLDETFWKYQTNDLDNVDISDANTAIELIRQNLMDVERLTEKEAELSIKRKYPNLYRGVEDEEDASEVEKYDDDVIQAGIDARRAVSSLKELKEKLMMPKQAVVEPTQEEIQASQAAAKAYQDSASSAISSFKAVNIDVTKDVTLEVIPESAGVERIADLVKNPQKLDSYFFDRYVKDGKTNHEAMVQDIYIGENFKSLMSSAIKQGITIGEERALKASGKAPSLRSTEGAVNQAGGEDVGNAWLNQLRKN